MHGRREAVLLATVVRCILWSTELRTPALPAGHVRSICVDHFIIALIIASTASRRCIMITLHDNVHTVLL